MCIVEKIITQTYRKFSWNDIYCKVFNDWLVLKIIWSFEAKIYIFLAIIYKL
jgi:hypothetical protein